MKDKSCKLEGTYGNMKGRTRKKQQDSNAKQKEHNKQTSDISENKRKTRKEHTDIIMKVKKTKRNIRTNKRNIRTCVSLFLHLCYTIHAGASLGLPLGGHCSNAQGAAATAVPMASHAPIITTSAKPPRASHTGASSTPWERDSPPRSKVQLPNV